MKKKAIIILLVILSVVSATVVLFVIPLKSSYETSTIWTNRQLYYNASKTSSANYLKTPTDLWARGNVTIQNTDSYAGTFTVEFTFRTLNRNNVDQRTTYLNPGESRVVSGEYNTSLGENWDWDYHVVPTTVKVPETISSNKRVPLLRW